MHLIWYATPLEATQELALAERCFDLTQDRPGYLLAKVGIARSLWREGKFRESLELVLPLRAEGLQQLKRDELGMLLNVIAGCYSSMGQSEQAFAYFYQALQEVRPARGNGFEVVLSCNLAHELIQLGDYHQALSYVQDGIEQIAKINNARLLSVLLINRVICLTNLERPQDAVADVHQLLKLPANQGGRGITNAHFETMAIALLRAGEAELGLELVTRASENPVDVEVPDEQLMLIVAQAELLMNQGRLTEAADTLDNALAVASSVATEGLSLRVRCLFFQAMTDVYERMGDGNKALGALRNWQKLHVERARLASSARYQAASLQTELLRLRQNLEAVDARRRDTERARAELEAINRQLSQKVSEVQALQAELEKQATRDFLTGLFNRRHLNHVLPQMLAQAQRDRHPLAVVIIDLDHFKAVNDWHGHVAGDQLLAAFGALLLQHGRKSDVAFRFGGEEFCLLMPRTDALSARRKVTALLKLWRSQLFIFESGRLSDNSFSAGVADSNQIQSFELLLKVADDRLLHAKRTGRNRVMVLDERSDPTDPLDPATEAETA